MKPTSHKNKKNGTARWPWRAFPGPMVTVALRAADAARGS